MMNERSITLRRTPWHGLPWLCLALFLLATAAPAWSAFNAYVDRTQISPGETLRLTLKADGGANGDPDLSALEQDFQILGRQSGSQIQIINGQMSQSRSWTLVLSPRPHLAQRKSFVIPRITLGKESTDPVTITVSGQPAAGSAPVPAPPSSKGQSAPAGQAPQDRGKPGQRRGNQDASIAVHLEDAKPYVQQEVRLEVEVVISSAVSDAKLALPDTPDARVIPLGKSSKKEFTRNGQRFLSVTRSYAVVPQKSGTLKLGSLALEGKRRVSNNNGYSPFGRLTQRVEPMVIYSDPVEFEVRPIPEAWLQRVGQSSPWLPARRVYINEQWTPETGSAQTGEPLTRTLTLEARGAGAEQLPDVEPPRIDGARIYPDQPKLETVPSQSEQAGRKIIKWAINPVRAGNLDIPGVRIPWWDTKNDRIAWAQAPGRRLEVKAAEGDSGPAPTADKATVPNTSERSQSPAGDGSEGVRNSDDEPIPYPEWQDSAGSAEGWNIRSFSINGLSVVFLSLWLATLLMWWLSHKRRGATRPAPSPASSPSAVPRRKALAALKQACHKGDATTVRQALMDWSALHWPRNPPAGPVAIAHRLEADAGPFERLDAALYQQDGTGFEGKALWKSLNNALTARRKAARKPAQQPYSDALTSMGVRSRAA